MPKQINTLTRREFLKGAAYASALSVGGMSGLASANFAGSEPGTASHSGVSSKSALLAVTLTNQSDQIVALDPKQPVSLKKVNGWVVVKINKAKHGAGDVVTGQQINLVAGQQCSFVVDAEVAPMLAASGTDIVITNEYSSGDNMVPVRHYEAMVA